MKRTHSWLTTLLVSSALTTGCGLVPGGGGPPLTPPIGGAGPAPLASASAGPATALPPAGRVTVANPEKIEGVALDPARPGQPLDVSLVVDGKVLATAKSDQSGVAGNPNAAGGFRFTGITLTPGTEFSITVSIDGGPRVIGTGRIATPPPTTTSPRPDSPPASPVAPGSAPPVASSPPQLPAPGATAGPASPAPTAPPAVSSAPPVAPGQNPGVDWFCGLSRPTEGIVQFTGDGDIHVNVDITITTGANRGGGGASGSASIPGATSGAAPGTTPSASGTAPGASGTGPGEGGTTPASPATVTPPPTRLVQPVVPITPVSPVGTTSKPLPQPQPPAIAPGAAQATGPSGSGSGRSTERILGNLGEVVGQIGDVVNTLKGGTPTTGAGKVVAGATGVVAGLGGVLGGIAGTVGKVFGGGGGSSYGGVVPVPNLTSFLTPGGFFGGGSSMLGNQPGSVQEAIDTANPTGQTSPYYDSTNPNSPWFVGPKPEPAQLGGQPEKPEAGTGGTSRPADAATIAGLIGAGAGAASGGGIGSILGGAGNGLPAPSSDGAMPSSSTSPADPVVNTDSGGGFFSNLWTRGRSLFGL